MNLFRELTSKPWEPTDAGDAHVNDEASLRAVAARHALKFFFGVIFVLFMLLTIAYGERMTWEDWRPLPESTLLWFNTIALVLSSVAMQWAVVGLRRDQTEDVRVGLLSGAVTAVVFIAGQLLAWRQLMLMGYFDATNPAIAFFILITGLHALHILGGLAVLAPAIDKVWRRGYAAEQVRTSVELCTMYWHFLLLVWLVLFGLLFSGNNNLAILLAICGLK